MNGSTVIGFYLDGNNAQNPVVIGSLGGKPGKLKKGKGFSDPNAIYPRYDQEESDANRLARGEKTESTPVQWRKTNVDRARKAFGGQWAEPKTPYAPKYPYNHVRETEPKPESNAKNNQPPKNCGHIEEFDDTPGAERLYRQHKIGTFTEWHPDGTEVYKVIKDRYVVIGKDDHLHVKGNGMITIDGTSHVLISGNAFIEIAGNCKEYIHGNYELKVGGNYDVQVGGYWEGNAGSYIRFTAPMIYLN